MKKDLEDKLDNLYSVLKGKIRFDNSYEKLLSAFVFFVLLLFVGFFMRIDFLVWFGLGFSLVLGVILIIIELIPSFI